MQKIDKKLNLNCSADKLFEVISSIKFEEEKNIKVNGSLKCNVKELSKDDSKMEIESVTTDYERGITGINKNKTEESTYRYVWNLKDKSCTWTMSHPMGKKVNISGTMKVSGSDDNSVLHNTLSIEIKVPLLGKKIEKMVLKEIEAGWSNYDKLVKEYAEK